MRPWTVFYHVTEGTKKGSIWYIIQIVTGVEVIIENFIPEVHKMLPEIEDQEQHFTNWGDKIFNDDRHASFAIPQNQTILPVNKVNNYEKAVTTSMLPGQQFAGNSARATVHIC